VSFNSFELTHTQHCTLAIMCHLYNVSICCTVSPWPFVLLCVWANNNQFCLPPDKQLLTGYSFLLANVNNVCQLGHYQTFVPRNSVKS